MLPETRILKYHGLDEGSVVRYKRLKFSNYDMVRTQRQVEGSGNPKSHMKPENVQIVGSVERGTRINGSLFEIRDIIEKGSFEEERSNLFQITTRSYNNQGYVLRERD